MTAFKQPCAEELAHDYLWRIHKAMPRRGNVGVFNRSHYEDIVTVRVKKLVPEAVWSKRFGQINAFEEGLTQNDVVIRKFYLHMSKKEQRKRFMKRLDEPEKNWKFSTSDVEERGHWRDYVAAYEDLIRSTSTEHAPWYVVPANNKWFTRIVVAQAVIDALEGLDLHFPKVDAAKRKELAVARDLLQSE